MFSHLQGLSPAVPRRSLGGTYHDGRLRERRRSGGQDLVQLVLERMEPLQMGSLWLRHHESKVRQHIMAIFARVYHDKSIVDICVR